jgi:hypothetical protein
VDACGGLRSRIDREPFPPNSNPRARIIAALFEPDIALQDRCYCHANEVVVIWHLVYIMVLDSETVSGPNCKKEDRHGQNCRDRALDPRPYPYAPDGDESIAR